MPEPLSRTPDIRRWFVRVCSHGHRVEWRGHPNSLGGWQHMDADDGGKLCGSGTTRTVEVVSAAEAEGLREALCKIAAPENTLWEANMARRMAQIARKALNAS